MVGSYSSTNCDWINWIVSADFPTPREIRIFVLQKYTRLSVRSKRERQWIWVSHLLHRPSRVCTRGQTAPWTCWGTKKKKAEREWYSLGNKPDFKQGKHFGLICREYLTFPDANFRQRPPPAHLPLLVATQKYVCFARYIPLQFRIQHRRITTAASYSKVLFSKGASATHLSMLRRWSEAEKHEC